MDNSHVPPHSHASWSPTAWPISSRAARARSAHRTSTPLAARVAARLDALDVERSERRARSESARRGTSLVDLGDALVRYREAGRGPTIVFVADPPVVLEQYDELLGELMRDHHVVVFEAPGFGFSVARPDFDFSFAGANDAIARFLRAIAEGPLTLAFPCVEAYAALDIADKHPDLVRRLVLPQAPSWSEELRWKARRDPRGLLGVPGLGQLAMRALKRKRAPAWFDAAVGARERLDEIVRTTDQALARGATFSLATAFQSYLVPSVEPPVVDTPTLVVWGEADRSHVKTRKESSRELARRVTLVSAPGVGHFPELERPAWFAGLVRDFLRSDEP